MSGICGRCWRRWLRSPTAPSGRSWKGICWPGWRRGGRATVTTPAQLGAKVRRELLARNVRARPGSWSRQLRRRGVYLRPDRVEGMSVLEVLLTVPEAAALLDALGRYADAIVDDPADGVPPRTRQQKMADCLLDLVLRPGEGDLPAVQAQLKVVAPVATMVGGDAAGRDRRRSGAGGAGPRPRPGPGPAPRHAPDGPPVDELVDDAPVDDGLVDDGIFGDGFFEDEAWWAEVEDRVLNEAWPQEDPPPAVQQRLWEEDLAGMATDPAWAHLFHPEEDPDPVPAAAAGRTRRSRHPVGGRPRAGARGGGGLCCTAEPSWWAAADAAVGEAGAAQLALDRALTRASRAVRYAEIADRADTDAREQSAAARISRAPDALTALRSATPAHRAALAGLLERSAGGGLADRPRIALTDALTGALLALTDAPALRAGRHLRARACRTGAGGVRPRPHRSPRDWAHHHPPTATAPPLHWTGSCAPATAAAANPAAAHRWPAANSTTTGPTPTGPPPPTP